MGQIKSLTPRGMYKKEAYTKLNHVSQKIRKKQRRVTLLRASAYQSLIQLLLKGCPHGPWSGNLLQEHGFHGLTDSGLIEVYAEYIGIGQDWL